jgi:hypothetical protein
MLYCYEERLVGVGYVEQEGNLKGINHLKRPMFKYKDKINQKFRGEPIKPTCTDF